METKDIIIFTAIVALTGFSLYRKYKESKSGKKPADKASDEMSASKDNNDYEPYSGK